MKNIYYLCKKKIWKFGKIYPVLRITKYPIMVM
nr:MAG TPA: hypothetical protein [Caudoviricetes sp.]